MRGAERLFGVVTPVQQRRPHSAESVLLVGADLPTTTGGSIEVPGDNAADVTAVLERFPARLLEPVESPAGSACSSRAWS